jgi:hypothetical protein
MRYVVMPPVFFVFFLTISFNNYAGWSPRGRARIYGSQAQDGRRELWRRKKDRAKQDIQALSLPWVHGLSPSLLPLLF